MTVKEIIENENHEREFNSPFGSIKVSPEKNLYAVLRKKYAVQAQKSMEQFIEFYKEYSGCTDLYAYCERDFQRAVSNSVDEIKKDLISMGVYDYDYDIIYKKIAELGCLDEFYSVHDDLTKQIDVISGTLEQNRQYREERKENRSRWEVTTFGGDWGDAVEDQAEAFGMNLLEGGIHSLVNWAGNKLDEKEAEKKLAALFEKNSTKSNYVKAVYNCAFSFHLGLIAMLKECGITTEWGMQVDEDVEKGKRMLNNLASGAIPKEAEMDIYQKTFDGMCYSEDIYIHLIKKFGDEDGSIKALADYFGVDLHGAKDHIALEFVKEHEGETEEDAHNAKKQLIDYCNDIKLDVSDDLECISYIDNVIQNFDIKYRTVDGIICKTREGADLARKELPEIQKFMSDIREPLEGDLLDYEENIKKKIIEIKEKFSSELVEKNVALMDLYLAKFDEQFCTPGFMKKLDRKEAGKKRMIKLLKGYNCVSKEDIINMEKYANDLLPKVGLSRDEAIESYDYIKECKSKFALNYIKSNHGNTEDDAKKAEQDLIALFRELEMDDYENQDAYIYIKKYQQDLDRIYRTVDGVECSTREGADLARTELEEFNQKVKAPAPDDLVPYETELLHLKAEFEEKFSSEIKQKCIAKIEKYLADFNKQFCSMGLLKSGTREQAADDKALKIIKQMDCSSEELIEKAYEKLDEYLPLVGITREQAIKTVEYLEKQRKRCNKGGSAFTKMSGLFKKK
jgi:hypothetical protein